MDLFLLSTSYIEDTICGIFKNIKRLHMLKENHINGLDDMNINYQIVLHNNIQEALAESDLVVVIKEEETPIYLEDQIEKIVSVGKKHVVLKYNTHCFTKIPTPIRNIQCIPTILLIGIGPYEQIEKVEFEINQQLSAHNLKIHQTSSNLCNQIVKCDILKEYVDFQNFTTENAQIMVYAFKRLDLVDPSNADFYVNFFHSVQPDIVIGCIEATNVNIKECLKVLKYRYNIDVSYIIKSKYFNFDNHYVKCLDSSCCDTQDNIGHTVLQKTTDYYQLVRSHFEEPEGIDIL